MSYWNQSFVILEPPVSKMTYDSENFQNFIDDKKKDFLEFVLQSFWTSIYRLLFHIYIKAIQ